MKGREKRGVEIERRGEGSKEDRKKRGGERDEGVMCMCDEGVDSCRCIA